MCLVWPWMSGRNNNKNNTQATCNSDYPPIKCQKISNLSQLDPPPHFFDLIEHGMCVWDW